MAEGDAVKVCVRVRPLIHREQGEQVNVLWQANNNVISQVDGSRSFTFDRVFPLHETTAEVYRDAAVPIIRSVLQGYNGTIFAYGQTSSGKTFTMMGTKDNPGIISLAIQEVFRIIQEDPTREFLLRVSYMEIYNETVTDLLCDDRRRKPLDVREDINRNVYVADLTDELVMTPEHVMQWIKRGEKNRHYGETKMNDRSSRSHAIFRMIIESRERIESGNAENCDGAVMVSHLNLVDLAGSERASQTAAEGVRLKEGCNINRSLFVLGQVIKKLSDGQVGGFINYRDSKLTRILQNSFGGNTKTVVICTVTPVSLDETLSTLQFASTAKHVRNTPHVNEVLDDRALLKRYQKQILDLKKQVENASSEIRAQAMAKEEHSQLLAEIKQLLKEKEDRIWNLSNVVIGSSQQAREDQRVKLKRRVTWAPGKIQASLCSAGDSSFQMGSTLTMSFAKRPKMSEPLSIPEIDDSICAETSVFEGAGCALDNSAQDPTWNFESGVTSREKMTALSHSMIDFSSESTSALTKDSSLQKCKELEQKVAELEEELKRRNEEYEAVVRKRDCLVNVTADLEEKLHSEDKDELQITSLSDRSESVPDGNEQNPMPEGSLEMPGKLSPLKTDEQELEKLNDSPLSNRTDGVDQDPVLGLLASPIHDLCREQIQMLEQKIADLEGNESPVNNDQTYLMESLQICDALMAEKLNAHEELADMQNNFDHLVNENESLKREMADLEKRLQEKQETNEFEMLEKETREEHEAQLIHEISNIKKLMQNAEVINQELENELDTKSKVLKEQEQIMAQLKRENEMLQKKVRSMDLLASMEDCDKLCDEVLQLKQSLSDAEAVTRDAQREAAFLRSENLELKEKMDELVIHCEKREKDASGYEKQLESEKSNAKRMQADLQKELQYAFNELNKLNGLLAGKVPKELLSHVELDKKVADYSKQLNELLEEKKTMEQEIASLLEYKSLPGEIENLKDQLFRLQEEALQNATVHEELLQKTEELEQGQISQKEEISNLMKTVMEAESTLESWQNEKRETEQLLTTLQQQMDEITGERDELRATKESLTLEMASLKDVEAELLSLRNEKLNLEEKLFSLQQHIDMMTSERDELKATLQSLVSERDQLKEDLRENVEMSIETQDDLRQALHDLQQQRQRVEELTSQIASLEQKSSRMQEELQRCQEELQQQIILVNNLRMEDSITSSKEKEATDFIPSLEEKVLSLQDKFLETNAEYEQLAQNKEKLEQEKNLLSCQIEGLTKDMKETQSSLESLLNEKLEAQRQLLDLQQQMETLQEQNHLKDTQQKSISAIDQGSQASHFENYLEQKTIKCSCKDLVQSNLTINDDLELESMNLNNSEADDEKKINQLGVELVTEELKNLKAAQQLLESERDQLKEQLEKNIEKLSRLQEEGLQNANVHEELLQKTEELEQGQISQKEEISNLMKTVMEAESTLESLQNEKRETEQLLTNLQQQMNEITGERDELRATKESLILDMASLTDMEAELCSLRHEKLNLEEKLFSLQQHIDKMTSESDELKTTLQSLVSERDQMKEDLRENVEMSIETQDHLREAQHDLQQQKLSIEELTCQIASLEQKSSILNHELQETIAVLKESNNERDLLEQMKQKLVLELEHLHNDIKNKELTIGESEKERTEAEQKVLALTVQLKSMSEEREELQKQSAETEEELKRTQEELDQQKQGVEKLANEISLLEEKSSELERELQEKSHILNKAVEDRHIFDQSKQGLVSEMEQVMEDLKNKDSDLKQAEKEKEAVSQKILELTNKMQSIAQERDDLVHSKKKLEEEAEKLREEFQQLKHEHNLLADQQTRKTSQIDELETELQQMQEKMRLSDTSIKQLGNEKVALQKQLQQCELKVASLHQEQEQMQQLLERVRSEKQTIYASLQDQEKAVAQLQDELITSQTKLETVKEECNERNAQLAEKVNEVTELLKEKASVEEENEQWVVKVSDAMVKNYKLEKKISSLESLVTLLRSTRNETSEEVDQLAVCTESLERKNQEWKVAQLQDELITSQTKLETVKEECNERNAQLAEKVNEVTELLKEKASVEEENEQWVVKVSDAMVKNYKLETKISSLESLVTLLRSTRNETSEEVDQLAVCTESLERKNQEWKDLVENVSTIYTNHQSLLKNLSRDLKRETEAQKQSMSAIKEGLSSTRSKTFGNLETEHTKLNSQIENLLHKFKGIDRSSAVKDKNYELVQDYESELCEVQKKNQELLLQCRSLEQHGTRWSKEAAKELKSRQAEYMNQLIIKKTDMMTLVVDDLSEAQVELNGIETDLKKEMQCKKEFTVWLEEFKDLHCDTTRLSDRVLGENRRIAGLIEHLTRRLKIIIQPKIKRDTVTYLKSLDADLEKKKKENKELLQKIQQIAPSVNSDILEEENVRLRETLKDVQAELKEKQRLVQSLENELSSAKADAKEKAEKALLLEEQLRSNTAESALSEMEVKMNEKEKHFQAALEEIQVLQEKVSKGAAPYKNEIERLRDQVVKGEMDRMKLTKSTEQQISSLKACVEDKEERLRKLREQLRRSQKDLDDTVGPGSSSAPAYPLTCGGGSGIVQSTAMLVLQSKNAELKREIAQYKRRCHQLSSNISSYEEELKQLKKQSPKTPTTLLSSLHDDMMSHSNTDLCSATEVSPRKSEMSSCYITSPGKTGLQRKRDLSQSKTVTHKPPPMSPNRERHSVPASSPGNTDHYRKRPASPHKTDGPLFSTLTASPCKKQKLPVKTDSPKEKFFDVRSKSLPYWPDKFFDNSNLGTLSDLSTEPADGNPRGELDKALHAGATTETTSDVNNWWDKAPTDKPNECKAS
ncbi:centromere-associated protein E-like isoform X1 [Eleutherodactylus coqui]|uniref:centromere-associated protein E-like isoform X1 n=1 Tax=Eleutherodactylus coqui TaxID=57060 RepID=UPI0034629CB8